MGAALFLLWLIRAVVVIVRQEPWDFPPGFNLEERCDGIAASCGAVTGFVLPWLTLAFVTFLFFINRFWVVPLARRKKAKESPHQIVPTAGSITGDVVGRDELCKVIIDSVRTRGTRRPQLIVGGVGTGKTAVIVHLAQLLVQYRATPVAISLRDVGKDFNFRDAAANEFKKQINARAFSAAEADKVWRYLSYDDRIVVLADGLEEAFTEDKDRDDRIRLAIAAARRDNVPLVIASRPHDSLRGMDASVLELEPLSEEAALEYLGSGSRQSDLRRIDWIVETAGVAEAPLYLRIAHELGGERMLSHLITDDEESPGTVDTRDLDRSALRRNLLDTWISALTRGRLHGESPLTPAHRQMTVAFIAALACVGLQEDKLEVKYAEALQPDPSDEQSSHSDGRMVATSGREEKTAALQPDESGRESAGRAAQTAAAPDAAVHVETNDPEEEWRTDEFRNEHLTRWLRERQRRLRASKNLSRNVNTRLAAIVNTRIAATWGAQLGLVEVRGEAVRFQHSVLQAYLGSLPLEDLLEDDDFLNSAFQWPDRPGRELLISMVLLSRKEAGRRLNEGMASSASVTTDSGNRTAATLVRILHERAEQRFKVGCDSKGLDMLAAAFEIGTVAPAAERRQVELARLAARKWGLFSAADPRNLEEAKLGLVQRLGDALREIDGRGRREHIDGRYPERKDVEEAYRKLFVIGCREPFSYPVRLAVAQEVGAGGGTAFSALKGEFRTVLGELNTGGWLETEEDWRKTVMSAWLAPLLLGSGRRGDARDESAANLGYWMGRLGRPEVRDPGRASENQGRSQAVRGDRTRGGAEGAADVVGAPTPAELAAVDSTEDAPHPRDEQERDGQGGAPSEQGDPWRGTYSQLPVPLLPISIEVALAKGFKYAANRRERHSQVQAEARTFLAEQALELLRRSGFWFSQLTLLQALGLWALPDDVDVGSEHTAGPAVQGVDGADIRARVRHWVDMAGSLRDKGREPHDQEVAPRTHRFVVEAGELVIQALESGRPERFMWIDEHGVTSKIGASATNRADVRKHHLWIPPSIGWSALHPRAQQLVADVLLLMNLADRGDDPRRRENRLTRANRRDLPPCITKDRSPLDPNLKIGVADALQPGKNCPGECEFDLCPYPPKGSITYHAELTETFCKRQQTLLDPLVRLQTAPWQEIMRSELRTFWGEMAARARR